jgi:hypothetical protein
MMMMMTVLLVPWFVCVYCACRLPTKVNQALISSLAPSSSKAASLKAVQKLAAVYQYNKCTPDVWQHLVDSVQQQGSLAGMLQLKAGPRMHGGVRCRASCCCCCMRRDFLIVICSKQQVNSYTCWLFPMTSMHFQPMRGVHEMKWL